MQNCLLYNFDLSYIFFFISRIVKALQPLKVFQLGLLTCECQHCTVVYRPISIKISMLIDLDEIYRMAHTRTS